MKGSSNSSPIAPAARAIQTSVCTGSLILGAAGLLRGKRATSHWAALEALRALGAIPVEERVVRDGNIITGAGVSAGMDFGASLVGELRGHVMAEVATLVEYAPEPPYSSGTMSQARPEVAAAGGDDVVRFLRRGIGTAGEELAAGRSHSAFANWSSRAR